MQEAHAWEKRASQGLFGWLAGWLVGRLVGWLVWVVNSSLSLDTLFDTFRSFLSRCDTLHDWHTAGQVRLVGVLGLIIDLTQESDTLGEKGPATVDPSQVWLG